MRLLSDAQIVALHVMCDRSVFIAPEVGHVYCERDVSIAIARSTWESLYKLGLVDSCRESPKPWLRTCTSQITDKGMQRIGVTK